MYIYSVFIRPKSSINFDFDHLLSDPCRLFSHWKFDQFK